MNYTFTLDVRVFDPASLARSAALRATLENLTPEQWAKTRTGTGCDLVMLLDPGTLPGCDIEQSTAERVRLYSDDDEGDADDALPAVSLPDPDEPAARPATGPTSNAELVADLMNYSRHGALMQLFIIDALTKQAAQIAAMTPADVRAAFGSESVLHPEAWHATAVELRDRLDAFYNRHQQRSQP